MTKLEAILMGLLAERNRTGYELLKVISASPSFGVRATAGSVYPALQRLVKAGLILAADASSGARPASSYRLTQKGESALEGWLREPVAVGTAEETEDLLLRLLFSDRMPTDYLRSLLSAYLREMKAQVASLEASAAAWVAMPLRQRLCLENGLRSARTQVEWAERALTELGE